MNVVVKVKNKINPRDSLEAKDKKYLHRIYILSCKSYSQIVFFTNFLKSDN